MEKYKCLVIDDERLAQELLEGYIRKIPCLEYVASCFSCMEAIPVLAKNEIHILFLDIHMPDMSGIDFLQSLKNPPATVLTTAFSEYAIESYELSVVDYLLKPIEFDRFFKAVFKTINTLQKGVSPQEIGAMSTASHARDHFFVTEDKKKMRVQFTDVLFVEALQKYIRIHTVNKRIITLLSLSKIHELLPSSQFVRIHRSFIVNIERIDSIETNMVRINTHELPISKGQRANFMRSLNSRNIS